MGRHFHLEDAHIWIFKRQMMVRLGGDFDFSALSENQGGEEKQKCSTRVHGGNSSTGTWLFGSTCRAVESLDPAGGGARPHTTALLLFAGDADEMLHLVEIFFEGFAA